MRRIVLLCSAGVSTSLLVKEMQKEAKRLGYECSIKFYPLSGAEEDSEATDVFLLAPQTAYALGEIKLKYPEIPAAVIPQEMYGEADAVAVLDFAQKMVGDY